MASDVISFSSAITASEKGGQWEHVASLPDRMRAAAMASDVISFSAAISACGNGGQWEHVAPRLDK
eukprot:9441937-Karenia_brevis.AAC.1